MGSYIWAHKGPYMGPYGPQPGPGPNPDWAPTRPRLGRVQGTYKGDFLHILLDVSGPYGPIRAHMGPYGPVWARPGPTHHTKPFQKLTLFLKKGPCTNQPCINRPSVSTRHHSLAWSAARALCCLIQVFICSKVAIIRNVLFAVVSIHNKEPTTQFIHVVQTVTEGRVTGPLKAPIKANFFHFFFLFFGPIRAHMGQKSSF